MSHRDTPSDPTAGFSDLQWYMYHQRNVAFFGAYTRRPLTDAELVASLRGLVALAPQLQLGFRGAVPERAIPDAVLARLIHRERVATLDGFPDRGFDAGAAIFADPELPLFRLRYAEATTPSPDGRHGFVLVQVAHALVEGADSALLSRSHSAAHPTSPDSGKTSLLLRAAAKTVGTLLPPFHLLAANLAASRGGPYAYVSRAVRRDALGRLAKDFGVRQRALFYALAIDALFDTGGPRRRISAAYSAVDPDASGRDAFMRMRMLFARFSSAADFAAFVRGVDARLGRGEARESGFNAEMNAQGMRLHRGLSRVLPAAYGPKLFRFMPFDMILGLIPPHRLGGPLTAAFIEPIYAGAALEGVNACVIVPGRAFVSFNFYIESRLLARIPRLDARLATLSLRSSGEP